ncbi:golgi apparatus membrane protein [Pochonia chlamydosporia 170]|uniref:Golgi apparatus membrane protein n=1 Tax=Pochonia chlamydosporia 170 TaxID=1380566 RepID=A0A179FTI5_METCM|nr:golgi apparatus membrane protein [Pochonia chlamydosporia 170]OAQ68403.1 golgi apparatus membrane protein [Pochonia chlamydosporia 170]
MSSSHGGPGSEYPQDYGQAYPQPAYPQAEYTQPTYTQPTYAENANLNNYDQGYAARQGLAPSAPAMSIRNDRWEFVKSKWSAAFMGVTTLQAIICLVFEAYVFAKFQTSLGKQINVDKVQSQYKTIPTFLTLFIFGFLYELVIVWDALRMKNTIQIIGVCIANLAMLVYTALQVDQIQMAINILASHGALDTDVTAKELWSELKAFLIAIPAVIGLVTMCMAFIAWKLYQEFAWDILKNIGADYRMKKRFLHYQIYIALLKFDFFFFLGFIIQFVVVVAQKSDPEFALTIATIPITIVILLAAAYFTRRENKAGTICVMLLFLGGLSYFVFKLVRIYQPDHKNSYEAVRKSLTAFAVITILLIILTLINAIICMRNFNQGLKAHLLSSRKVDEKPDATSISLHDVKPQMPSRMTID